MLLTVIIVTKNPGDDIYATLSSVMPLDDASVEVLIKDNSDSRTLEGINECFQFTNFRYIHSVDNGIYDAMNQAIELAKGTYLYFLNAGDTYIDCYLLNILKEDHSKTDFFYGNIINLHPFAREISYSKYVNKYSVYLRRVCHQAIVVRKDLFKKLGSFDTKLKINADYLFILHLFDQFSGKSLNKLIAVYKGGGLSFDYKMPAADHNYLKDKLTKIFNPIELGILSFAAVIVRCLVFVKNINKKK